MALGIKEGVGHAAADRQGVELADQVLQQVELARYLRAADDAQCRALGIAERGVERVQLTLHRQAGIGRQQVRQAFGRGVSAVRRRKGVVDVEVAIGRQLPGEVGIVLFLTGVEADVFQQGDTAGLEGINR